MPDLHEWISQQIAEREQLADLISPGGFAPAEWRIEPSRSGWWTWLVAYSRCNNEPPEAARRDSDQPAVLVQTGRNEHLLIAMHDPAAVLRRCAADRKILARHCLNPDAYWSDRAICQGCGTTGDCDWPVTDNLNDCPELLDLAEGYGLTPEIYATLDRPQRGERPEPSGRSVIHDSVASMYGALYKQVMETTFASSSAANNLIVTGDPAAEPRLTARKLPGVPIPDWLREDLGLPDPAPEPTPGERAFAVVEPHLSALTLYKPDSGPETRP